MTKALKDKLIESLTSIVPIALIIMLLCASFTPVDTGTFTLFFIGTFLLIVGMGFFTLGADPCRAGGRVEARMGGELFGRLSARFNGRRRRGDLFDGRHAAHRVPH